MDAEQATIRPTIEGTATLPKATACSLPITAPIANRMITAQAMTEESHSARLDVV